MNRARRAITLIEMLVAVLIIAVVTALTLPAIQSARESVRSAKCRHNLRQVALAANQYESIFLRYPPAVVASGYSAHTAILPYLEMTSVYQSINISVRQVMLSWEPENSTVAQLRIEAFICPSDTLQHPIGLFHYPGCAGWNRETANTTGIFGRFTAATSAASIRDGHALTIAFSEWLAPERQRNPRPGVRKTYFVPGQEPGHGIQAYLEACSRLSPESPGLSVERGSVWLSSHRLHSSFDANDRPNGRTCSSQGDFGELNSIPASSFHLQSVHAAFADGHVSGIRDGIALNVWRALATKAGGEPVDLND